MWIVWFVIVLMEISVIVCCHKKEWKGLRILCCLNGTAIEGKNGNLIWTEEKLFMCGPTLQTLKKIKKCTRGDTLANHFRGIDLHSVPFVLRHSTPSLSAYTTYLVESIKRARSSSHKLISCVN